MIYVISFEYTYYGTWYEQDAELTPEQAAAVLARLNKMQGEHGEPICSVDVSPWMPPKPLSHDDLTKELDVCFAPFEIPQ